MKVNEKVKEKEKLKVIKIKVFSPVLLQFLLTSLISIYPTSPSLATVNKINHPVPAESPDSLLHQLKRYVGQHKFLNLPPWYHRFFDSTDAQSLGLDKERREMEEHMEEHDVFKVGKPGSKILFVLNPFRGIQVISFENGPLHPTVIGRVEVKGGPAQNMYYDRNWDRLLIIQKGSSSAAGSILIYDVSRPTAPALSHWIKAKGKIIDSRMVKNILYVAAQSETTHGSIQYLKLLEKKVKEAGSLYIRGKISDAELINVVESGEGDYLLLPFKDAAPENPAHFLTVLDISHSQGELKPVMTAQIRGMLQKRQYAHVRERNLITVSNYRTPDDRLKVAVETFPFPPETNLDDSLIDMTEVRYKLHQLDLALSSKRENLEKIHTSPSKIEKLLESFRDKLLGGEVLYKGKALALKKKFVRNGPHDLLAPVPQKALAIDGNKSSLTDARIRDVLFDNQLLYIFLDSKNSGDPVDIFDITHPAKGVLLKGRIFFEGWVERAIPILFNNERYIIGLGRFSPNGEGPKQIQFLLFRLLPRENGIKSETLSQLILPDPHLRVDFNSADRKIEWSFDPQTGRGNLLFEGYRWDGETGVLAGKLVEFDLTKGTLSEGGLLPVSTGLSGRIFANPEISRINSLSPSELRVFDVDLTAHLSPGRPGERFAPVATLELSRNIIDYFSLFPSNVPRSFMPLLGVQILAPTSDHPFTTTLRFVDPASADADKNQILGKKDLPGQFRDAILLDDKQLIIETEKYGQGENGEIQSQIFLTLMKAGPGPGQYELITQDFLESPGSFLGGPEEGSILSLSFHKNTDSGPVLDVRHGFLLLSPGELFLLRGKRLYRVGLGEDSSPFSLQPLSALQCKKVNANLPHSLMVLENKFFLFHQEWEEEMGWGDLSGLRFERYFLTELLPVQGDPSRPFQCGPSFNIPGTPVSLHGDNLVTLDAGLTDFLPATRSSPPPNPGRLRPPPPRPDISTELYLVSLKRDRERGHFVTTDLFPANSLNKASLRSLPPIARENRGTGHGFIFFETSASPAKSLFSYLFLDENLRFLKETFQVNLQVSKNPRVENLISLPGNQGHYMVVGGGRSDSQNQELQILEFSEKLRRPRILNLAPVDLHSQRGAPVTVLERKNLDFIPWWGKSLRNKQRLHFTRGQTSFEFIDGPYGIRQFFKLD